MPRAPRRKPSSSWSAFRTSPAALSPLLFFPSLVHRHVGRVGRIATPHAATLGDSVTHPQVEPFFLGSGFRDFAGKMRRDYDDAVLIADHEVTGKYRHAAAGDDLLNADRH